METELQRLWNLVSEITEQLNQNKLMTERLQSHAGQLREQAGQTSDGVTLRRFNTDLSKEILTSELERISVALIMENQSLLHENKQLNSLLQDYEKTLQTVLEKFRGHCHAAQIHQLTLNRHYETLLAQERTEDGSATRATDMEHFANLTTIVSRVLKSMEGKESLPSDGPDGHLPDREEGTQGEDEDDIAWQGMGDWAEERETEIQRLERENAELRHILGISQAQGRELGLDDLDGTSPSRTPTWNRRSFSFPVSSSGPSSFRDDRSRATGRSTLGLVGGGTAEQRRPGLFGRSGFEAEIGPGVSSPERVLSPPNEIRWGKEVIDGPVTESI